MHLRTIVPKARRSGGEVSSAEGSLGTDVRHWNRRASPAKSRPNWQRVQGYGNMPFRRRGGFTSCSEGFMKPYWLLPVAASSAILGRLRFATVADGVKQGAGSPLRRLDPKEPYMVGKL